MSAAAGRPLPSVHQWPVVLDHGPVRLRPLRRRDARAWDEVRGRGWDWLSRWEPTLPPGPDGRAGRLPSFGSLVRTFNRQARETRALPFVIEWRGERPARLIGFVTVAGITLGSARHGQIGYWVDEAFAGHGITPLAVAMAGDYALEVVGLHRLEICIRPENAPSLRVVEKLGFRDEGTRPRYLHIDGAWRDHRAFALDADELAGETLLARCPAPRFAGLPGTDVR